jgi:RNA polymerase sporulation-specific sigma factor
MNKRYLHYGGDAFESESGMKTEQDKNHQSIDDKQSKSDENMLVYAQNGDDEAMEWLITRYKAMVRARARQYYLAGADREDLVQEGMIGLFKAVRDYQKNMNIPFYNFANLCVSRQLMTAVKTAARKKHIPLNTYISLSMPTTGDELSLLPEQLCDNTALQPEYQLIRHEEAEGMAFIVERVLSEFEKSVLSMYLNGIAYQNIAEKLDKSVKSVDNALQRIRRKLEKHLN